MKARYFRLLVGMGTLMVYTAAAGWMVLSIAKPAPPDAIGVPVMMWGICMMCIVPVSLWVRWWVQRKASQSEEAMEPLSTNGAGRCS